MPLINCVLEVLDALKVAASSTRGTCITFGVEVEIVAETIDAGARVDEALVLADAAS